MINVLFIGAPGSGKGTQAAKLISQKNLIHLSTGDLFRKNLKEKTPLGQLAKSYIDKGHLVPDQVTNDMVKDFIKSIPQDKGIVFDGFPRSLSQAIALDMILKETDRKLDKVIFLKIPDEQIVKRLTGRLWAPNSGCVYHIKNNPPKQAGFCDESGEALVTRSDDREEVLRSRLNVFHKNTKPLLNHYEKKGLLKNISAGASPKEVFHQILQAFKED